ncbi:MAG: branched-chain amino acid ABC transporter permease [Betaproteobacteria bacterium]
MSSPSLAPLPWWRQALPYGVLLALALLIYFVFPDQLPLAARIAALAIFVMSLDLVVGYGGLATLGHSALYGVGAYAAGLLAMHLSGNPLLGLLAGAGAGAALAFLSGLFLLRYEGLTFLMLSIAISQIVQNLASKLRQWTGGDDGLSGFSVGKVLGLASFDLQGRIAFLYCFAVMFLSLWLMRRLMASPFGLACQGIHQNRQRMAALGTNMRGQLLKLYTLSGVFAGISGALAAQVAQIVGLDTLGFELSAEALVMLVLGGAGNLWGALVGTVIFASIHHWASTLNPYHWLFIIGGMLVLMVLLRERVGLAWSARLAALRRALSPAPAGAGS